MNELLSSYQNLNERRYIRLICFSACDLVGTPIAVIFLSLCIKGLPLFNGLSQEHHDFSEVIQVPAIIWHANVFTELQLELNRWILIFGAFVFFAIFGFTEESRSKYRAAPQSVIQAFVMIAGIKFKTRPNSNVDECVTPFFFFFRSTI